MKESARQFLGSIALFLAFIAGFSAGLNVLSVHYWPYTAWWIGLLSVSVVFGWAATRDPRKGKS